MTYFPSLHCEGVGCAAVSELPVQAAPAVVTGGQATLQGRFSASALLHINVGLAVRNSHQLDQLIAAASTPGNPQYGHYLTESQTTWTGHRLEFSGKAKGFVASGTLEITEIEIILDGKLPLIARPFEPKIKSAIEQEAASMFPSAGL